MPCPHNEISIVQRSQQQSAVAAAAYQSGEKLFCEYDQQVKHYPAFIHQPLETAFAECIIKVFYIIAPQLVDGDAHDQFGRALLSLQIGCCQNCDKRC